MHLPQINALVLCLQTVIHSLQNNNWEGGQSCSQTKNNWFQKKSTVRTLYTYRNLTITHNKLRVHDCTIQNLISKISGKSSGKLHLWKDLNWFIFSRLWCSEVFGHTHSLLSVYYNPYHSAGAWVLSFISFIWVPNLAHDIPKDVFKLSVMFL